MKMTMIKRICLHVLQAIAYICAYFGTLSAAVAGKHGINWNVYIILFCAVLLPIMVFHAVLWIWTKDNYSRCFDIIGLCISALAVVILLQISSFSLAWENLVFIVPWLIILAPNLIMFLRKR